jgi:hypothetical protein
MTVRGEEQTLAYTLRRGLVMIVRTVQVSPSRKSRAHVR